MCVFPPISLSLYIYIYINPGCGTSLLVYGGRAAGERSCQETETADQRGEIKQCYIFFFFLLFFVPLPFTTDSFLLYFIPFIPFIALFLVLCSFLFAFFFVNMLLILPKHTKVVDTFPRTSPPPPHLSRVSLYRTLTPFARGICDIHCTYTYIQTHTGQARAFASGWTCFPGFYRPRHLPRHGDAYCSHHLCDRHLQYGSIIVITTDSATRFFGFSFFLLFCCFE